ncbi:MAG: hypothetical protein LC792_16520, partial [Actinobacteria bacterium]|nr:hypothetical protein [Actinomycetota bacterium]
VLSACVVRTNPTGTVAAGAAVTVQGTGCRSASEVGIQSAFIRLATVTPDATGAFTITVTIPSDTTQLPLGTHQIVVRAANGVVLGSSTGFSVTASTGGSLVRTGVDALLIALLGTVALAVGSYLRLHGHLPGRSVR